METLDYFLDSLQQGSMPAGIAAPLEALWHEGGGDWQRAHEIVQAQNTADAAWVHAYLHRKEGDLANAGYWYRRARRQMPTASVKDEWRDIVSTLIVIDGRSEKALTTKITKGTK